MRTDFENIPDRSRVRLFPRPNNPLHKKPVEAMYVSGYYVCDGTFLERNDGRVFFYTTFKGYVPVSDEVAELAIATEKAKVASRIAAIKQKFKDIGITFAQRDADFGSWKV